jgi:hypothetical protein
MLLYKIAIKMSKISDVNTEAQACLCATNPEFMALFDGNLVLTDPEINSG